MIISRVLLLVVAAALCGCSQSQQPGDQEGRVDLAAQMIAMQQDIHLLRQDMAAVRQAVTEMHRNTLAPPLSPPAQPVAIDVRLEADSPVLGDPEATVAIVEFSDFQCPYCRRYQVQIFPKIKQRYIDKGKLRYVFRDFPMDFHPQARAAAMAAKCAARQGKFPEFKEALFQNQRQLDSGLYPKLAATIGLETSDYERCLQDAVLQQEIDRDLQYGQSIGVNGTPTFFIGRVDGNTLVKSRRIIGSQPLASFTSAIDALLADPG